MPRSEIHEIRSELQKLRNDVQALREEIARYRGFIGGAWWVIGTLAVGVGFLINLLIKN